MTPERAESFEEGMLLHVKVVGVESYFEDMKIRLEILDRPFQDCFFDIDTDNIEEY